MAPDDVSREHLLATKQESVEKTTNRLTWVDRAKGLAIILVVLYHASFFMNAAGWGWEPLTRANGALASFRMPLFFFCSGLFFSRQLSRPARGVLTGRILPMLWLYAVWSLVFAVFFSVVPWIRNPDRVPMADLPWIFVRPSTELWFLYALALYFAVAWTLNKVLPRSLQLLAALGLAVVATIADFPVWAFDDMARYFVVFLVAVHFAEFAFRYAASSTWASLVIAAIAWVVLLAGRELGPPPVSHLLELPVSFVAVAAGIALSVRLKGRMGSLLQYIGSRTLSVYVLHVLLLGALFAYAPSIESVPWWGSLVVAGLATIAITLGTAWMYPRLLRVPGLLRAPWLRGAR